MGDLTSNLSRHEFACECGCGFDTVDFELVTVIQKACNHFEAIYQADLIIEISVSEVKYSAIKGLKSESSGQAARIFARYSNACRQFTTGGSKFGITSARANLSATAATVVDKAAPSRR